MHRLLTLCLVPLIVLMGSCTEGTPAEEETTSTNKNATLTIVCSVGMVADVVRAVAGDGAEVVTLIGPGVDPHLYNPTRSDIQRINDADAIFYNGHFLEGKMIDALTGARDSGKPVFAVAEEVDRSRLLEDEEHDGVFDPHLWMDPGLWAETVDVVRDAMIAFDPDGAQRYTQNAAAYRVELETLDDYASEVLSSVPSEQRVLITSHDAFNYFGDRYGFEVIGIQGLSTESEAGLEVIERLVDLLVSREVRAVFVESTVSDRNIRSIVTGARNRGHEVVIGGELYSDAMGNRGTYEGTYIGMIDHNATTVARALGGEAPERGLNGSLSE